MVGAGTTATTSMTVAASTIRIRRASPPRPAGSDSSGTRSGGGARRAPAVGRAAGFGCRGPAVVSGFGFAGLVLRVVGGVADVVVGVDLAGRLVSSEVLDVVGVVAFVSFRVAVAAGAGSGFGTGALVPAAARGVDRRQATPTATAWRVRRPLCRRNPTWSSPYVPYRDSHIVLRQPGNENLCPPRELSANPDSWGAHVHPNPGTLGPGAGFVPLHIERG